MTIFFTIKSKTRKIIPIYKKQIFDIFLIINRAIFSK